MKNEIKSIILENSEHKGFGCIHCKEDEELCINDISLLVDDIASFIQAITDPENQPNQYGIKLTIESVGNDFKKAIEPAIRYLLKNHNPHTKIYIDYSNAELLQGEQCHNLTDEIPD